MTALERAIRSPQPVRGFEATSPLHGLDRRSVGFFDVFAQSVAAVAPAAAATTVALLVAGLSPTVTVASILVAGVLSLLVARTVSQFARRFAAAGALYTYVARGLGTGAGLSAGAAVVVGYAAIAMFALLGGAHYTTLLLGAFWPGAPRGPAGVAAVLVVEGALLVLVLVRGIRLSSRLALIVEAVSVVLIATLLVVLLLRIGPIDLTLLLPSSDDSPLTVAAGALIALTAYVGFESAATLGVEARTPLRTVPRAIRWTVVVSALLYLLAAAAQVAGFDAIGVSFAESSSPVNDLADAYGLGGWAIVADLGIAASFLACAIGSTTALTRVLFTMGRDGVLPAFAGRTHRRFGTPIGAVALTLPVIIGVPLGLILSGLDLRTAMHLTIVVGGFGYIVSYALVCVAAPVFLRRIGESTLGSAVVAIGCAVALAGAVIAFAVVDLGSGSPAVWVAAGVAAVAAIAIVWRRRSAAVGTIGVYDEPVIESVLGGIAQEGSPHDDRHRDG
ncbi:APC family permease [Microbacterium sp. No. 7]|uniref:APC family permease n=1 Tax=Microbacterium sp. No. 7 TaxID=1714373 RepID=UPI0006D0E73C|nr:APC family permease [Microbacterium sp. No. 7]ALJ19453.1 amino acid transporter [Microbacterium sp. No. 7]